MDAHTHESQGNIPLSVAELNRLIEGVRVDGVVFPLDVNAATQYAGVLYTLLGDARRFPQHAQQMVDVILLPLIKSQPTAKYKGMKGGRRA